ncbi:hypothetical protein ACFO5K_25395 [Nocardia halotolerans]|uniref:Uncharacterized protein n=1 Tax=Nocardia halotolerans TaxID=1755878 RepID=A0ABV8VPA0_9NOCA
MSERIAGKTFRSEAEAAADDGKPMMTEAERVEYLRQFDAFDDALRAAPSGWAPVGGKFSDDVGESCHPDGHGHDEQGR